MLKKLKESRYVMQIVTLLSGSIMAQALLFAFIPIVTRLYTPSEFGIYSLFFSMTMAIGLISSFKYDQAIVLPKNEQDAKAILFLSLMILFAIVLLCLLVVWIFYDWFVQLFGGEDYLVWFLPVSVLVLGGQLIFESFANRQEYYKVMSLSKIMSAIGTVTTQISSRYLFQANGLIVGKILSDMVAVAFLLKQIVKRNSLQLQKISRTRVYANAKHYSHFPKFQTASTLINYVAQNLPIYLLPFLFSTDVVGYYALAFRVLMTPTTLMTVSVQNVYYQKAAKMFANHEDIRQLYMKTTLGLLKIYIAPLFIIVMWGEEIFSFLFGQEWSEAGLIAKFIVCMAFFSFINPPSTMTFNLLSLQKTQLIVQSIQIFLRLFALLLGYYLFHTPIASIAMYVTVAVCVNLFNILFIRGRLNRHYQK